MKEFFRLLRRFVPPYKKYLIWALFLNLLSAILNIFSFALIIPILQILFKMDTKTYEFIPWDAAGINMKDIAVNNFYYYVTEMIACVFHIAIVYFFAGLFGIIEINKWRAKTFQIDVIVRVIHVDNLVV